MLREIEKESAAQAAVARIRDQQIVGLGTGSTAAYAISAIGGLVGQGLQIRAVATSRQTESLAKSLHIPLINIEDVYSIDITIDGADEFTPDRMLIKGGGGALLREKIVAAMSKKLIIIADASKQVETLGKFRLPLAVVPFAAGYVLRQLEKLNGQGMIRKVGEAPFLTDDGHYIIDADFGLITNPADLSDQLNVIEGVAAHGLFIRLVSKVIMGKGDSIIEF